MEDLLKRYHKIILVLSLVCFYMLGINSVVRNVVLLGCLFFIITGKYKYKSITKMPIKTYICAAIIEVLYGLLVSGGNLLINAVYLILSAYFVIYALDYISVLCANKLVSNENNISTKLTKTEYSLIAASSIVVMTFFTTSSPLYKINYWDDANCFFTLGRGIVNGLVPYKDIYEQKGPYLYFLHAIAALISPNTFTGAYIIEIVMAMVFMTFVWKIVKLFYRPGKYSLLLIPVGMIFTYSVYSFYFGDSAEELSFPLLTIVLYIALKNEKNNSLPSKKETAVVGVISGFLFLLKYTFCTMIFGYILYLLISSIVTKRFKKLLINIGMFLAGFAAALAPMLIYFGINGALNDMFTAYFYNNIFLYTQSPRYPFTLIFSHYMAMNKLTFAGLVVSVFCMVGLNKKYGVLYASMALFAGLGIYVPATHNFYYTFILTALIAPAFLLMSVLIDKVCTYSKVIKVSCISLVIASGIFMFATNNNIRLIGKSPDEIPQITFAEEIKSTENAKVLTYDVMDAGFYTYSNVLPSNKYYCYLNIEDALTELKESQNQGISEGAFDYVITNNEYDFDCYELIMTQTVSDHNQIRLTRDGEETETYYLYKLAQ